MKKYTFFLLLLVVIPYLFGQGDINPNGYNKIYYPNGSVQSEGLLKNGIPEGKWVNYFPTGIKKSEGLRKNNQLDSIWVFYNLVGDTLSKINYLLGKKNGYSYEYYTDNIALYGTERILYKELYVNDLKEGKSFYYYPNGNIHFESEYHGNKKDGLEIEYAEDGMIITIFRNRKGIVTEMEKINRLDNQGNKTGSWKTFYEGVRVKTEANFKNNMLDGYSKEYDPSGKLISTLLYRENKLVETVNEDQLLSEEKIEYFEDGKVKNQGLYKSGKPIGMHKSYTKDGDKIIAEIFSDEGVILSRGGVDEEGLRYGPWEEYYKDGIISQKGNYRANKREGKWDFYSKSGSLEQSGNYKEGFFDGEWIWYYENKTVWKEEVYLKGLLDGPYVEYDINGNIIVQGEYLEGEREGEWITQINDNKAVGKYVTGLMDGKWKSFYADGTLAFEGSFIQGNANGKHKYYYPDGKLKEEQYYNQGIKEDNWKKYYPDGELFLTITYKNNKEFRINGVKIDFPTETVKLIN